MANEEAAMAAPVADEKAEAADGVPHGQGMEHVSGEVFKKAKVEILESSIQDELLDELRAPLWKQYNSSYTYVLVALILANLGLILYAHIGLSGVIFTSFDLTQTPPPSTPAPTLNTPKNQCTALDLVIWQGNGTASRMYYNNALLICGSKCRGTDPTCIKPCMKAKFDYSEACSACFSQTPLCTVSECSMCMKDSKGCECVDCVNLKCAPTLELCLGMGAVNLSECTQQPPAPPTLPPLSSISTLYPAYDIGFGPSVKDAYNAGAKGIAAIIVIFSGAWPYLKIIIMLTAWFAPFAIQTRYKVLKLLVRASKLTLVDVYAVIVIMAGVNVYTSVMGQPILIKTETRGSIYSFLLSSLLQLSLENWMMYLHNQKSEDNTDQNTKKIVDSIFIQKNVCNLIVKCQEKFYEVSYVGLMIVFLISCASFGLLIAGMALPIISFRTVGVAATGTSADYQNLTFFDLGQHSLSAVVMYKHAEPSGARFLVTFYYILGIALPLASALLTGLSFIYLVCFRVSMKLRKGIYRGISMMFSYSSIEILLLATVVVIEKYSDLIQRAVGGSAASFCVGKTGDECFGIHGQAQVSACLLTLFGFILLWILQWIFAFMLSYLRLPDSYAILDLSPKLLRVIRPLIREIVSLQVPAIADSAIP
eukprot:768793-Hanusia_phi.AAC.13